jgi:three-Cys-motif partner protein
MSAPDENEITPAVDGLICPEVGAWAETKHRLISLYSELFSSGMKDKWDNLVYIELYAGAGYSRIRGTSKLIFGSPLRSLMVKHRFDKYIFCEEDPVKMAALKTRVRLAAPSANVTYISGDCNSLASEIAAAIPHGTKDHTVLSLCFADPYDIGLKFETLRTLSTRYIDFLALLALGMDANRNYDQYVKDDAVKVDEFLGSDNWRERWASAQWDAVKFTRFLANEFTRSMTSLGYIPPPFYKMKEVRSNEKNLPLYHLALFSRHDRAYKLWDQVLKYSTDQTQLWE